MIALKDRKHPVLRGDLQNRLDYLRDRVREVWDGALALPHFTRHGYDHCVRIEEHLEKLLPLLREPLTLAEQYILLSAVWTHDIGMQDIRFTLGDTPITALTDQDYITIRERHPAASEAWILDVLNERRQRPELGLKRDDYVYPIARVARAHTNFDLNDIERMRSVAGSHVRLRLLAVLLIIADELDLDGRRVDLDRLVLADIPNDSKVHWWCHHYVDGVYIAGHTPRIEMTLPQVYRGLVAEEWKMRVAAGLRKQLLKDVVRATLEEEGCWLTVPDVAVTFETVQVKRLGPPEMPLDTRGAVRETDVQLLQGFTHKDVATFMAVNVYGVPFSEMVDDERDSLHAGVITLMQGWSDLRSAHLTFLMRKVGERVSSALQQSSLSPLTRVYWYTWARLSMMGRYQAHVVPRFLPQPVPEEPTEQYCWEHVRESWKLSDETYYAARDKASLEAASHKVDIDSVRRIVDDASSQIEMAAVISNGMMARLDDAGFFLAFGQLGPALNAQTGPRAKVALEEMRRHSARLNQPDIGTDGAPPASG